MLWALDENENKIEAVPEEEGKCPFCKGKVFSRCGEINVWHWAHYKFENCDSWHEPETFWHLKWKMTFGKENTEIIIEKNKKRHKADILTTEDVVIELQNSSIQNTTIREREEFYGKRMLWLINGIDFKNNFEISEIIQKNNSIDINRHFRLINENSDNEKDKYYFRWKYARKSWRNAERPIFIDFGEDRLFWVKKGMGTGVGNGKYVSKENFINKYGGDYQYYCQQFSNNPADEKK